MTLKQYMHMYKQPLNEGSIQEINTLTEITAAKHTKKKNKDKNDKKKKKKIEVEDVDQVQAKGSFVGALPGAPT
jgi:hypothetical protein